MILRMLPPIRKRAMTPRLLHNIRQLVSLAQDCITLLLWTSPELEGLEKGELISLIDTLRLVRDQSDEIINAIDKELERL